LEKQQEMFEYADDGYQEVHIKTDGAVVMLRRELAELAREDARGGEYPAEAGQRTRKAAAAGAQ
jgi:hypothetical protein